MYKDFTVLKYTIVQADFTGFAITLEGYIRKKLAYTEWNILDDVVYPEKIYHPSPVKGANYERKIMIWSPTPNNDITLFFTNLGDGWFTLLNIMSEVHGYPLTMFSFSTEVAEEDPMLLFWHIENGNERLVRVSCENGKWDFYQSGKPLGFEAVETYQKRLKKERLTNELLLNYSKSLGFDPSEPIYWSSRKPAKFIIENRH